MAHHRFFSDASTISRREMLRRCGTGFGALALADLMSQAGLLSAVPQGLFTGSSALGAEAVNPMLPKLPPLAAKAKHVIHIFLNGGPSQVDTFDPKPALEKYAGKSLPMENLKTERKTGAALPSPFKFQKYGESGIEVSEIFPHVGQCIDDVAVIRSMHADVPNHEPSLLLMNCGEARLIRPSMGSWVTYGLGTENQNLPAFIAMCPGGYPIQESQNWQAGFLPGVFQGTYIDTQNTNIEKLIENVRSSTLSARSSGSSSIWCRRSTGGTRRRGSRIRSSNRAFKRSSWRTACKRKWPRRSMSAASRSTFAICTAKGRRPGRF